VPYKEYRLTAVQHSGRSRRRFSIGTCGIPILSANNKEISTRQEGTDVRTAPSWWLSSPSCSGCLRCSRRGPGLKESCRAAHAQLKARRN